jgi:hypothetical protein
VLVVTEWPICAVGIVTAHNLAIRTGPDSLPFGEFF